MPRSLSRTEVIALFEQYSVRDPSEIPFDNYMGYFCSTARPVSSLITDHHVPGRASPPHSHTCLAFNGCLQGPITLLLEDSEQVLDAGTCYLFPAGVRHHWRNDGPHHAVMLSFLLDANHPGAWPVASGVRSGCLELQERVQTAMRFEVRDDALLQQTYWQLADCLRPDRSREAMLVTGLIWTLIGRLLECLRPPTPDSALNLNVAQQMRRFLLQRIQDRLSIAAVAGSVHLSPSRAKEIFRKAFGCGIMTYFNQLKIQQAKQLLCDQSLTIKQISQRLGFSSPTYFDRVFFRHTGLLPTKFRNG